MKSVNFVIAFLFSGVSLFSQTHYDQPTQEKISAFENSLSGRVIIENEGKSRLEDRMEFFHVKGLSIAVIDNYQVAWAKGYGWADEAEKRPVTTETLFEPGSISKTLNAVGVLKLAQDKKLDLHTDINTYLKSWQFPYDSIAKNKKITLAQLLSHSAGLTVHGFPGYDLEAKIPSVPEILDGKAPANTPPVRSAFEPGLKFQYSGGGTTISQLIISDITGQPYDAFMYDNVLKPIGMVNSFYTQPAPPEKRSLCASAYYRDGSPVPNRFHQYPEQAAAGLWMTPTDLCQYIIATQMAYQGKPSKVVNEEMAKLMLTPYNDPNVGLGVFVENHDKTIYFQHSAGNEGFCGIFYGSLEGGKGLAVFMNSDNFGLLPEVVNSIASVYAWEHFYTPVYKKAVAVSDSDLPTSTGIYLFDNTWASIFKKDGSYFYSTDGITAKMYFSARDRFFNKEFQAEKTFTRDLQGNITGFLRQVGEVVHPPATKVTRVDTLNISKGDFNSIGWHLLENKRYAEAASYLNRGLQLYPGDLILLGNLAHCYLFDDQYAAAMDIYKAHLEETIEGNMTWKNMIENDFIYLKRQGLDSALMDKIFADLEMEVPAGY